MIWPNYTLQHMILHSNEYKTLELYKIMHRKMCVQQIVLSDKLPKKTNRIFRSGGNYVMEIMVISIFLYTDSDCHHITKLNLCKV